MNDGRLVGIRAAVPGDAAPIVELIRETFDPWVIERSPYGCTGIGSYLARLIDSAAVADARYVIAEAAGEIAGAGEIRRVGASSLISYLAVRASAQGQGIGTRLVRGVVSGAGGDDVLVDVFDDNVRALALYTRLGFTLRSRTGWWERELPAPTSGPPAVVTGLPEANVAHDAYGFSQIVVHGLAGDHVVGRLGNRWWRIRSAEVVADQPVVNALHRLDGSRRILGVAPLDGAGMAGWAPPARSARRLAGDAITVAQATTGD